MLATDARFYADFHGLTALKADAAQQDAAAIDEAARQFESLFLQMMLKSMRDASLGNGMLESDQGLFYRDLYDKQLALKLSQSGGLGLAEVIKRQLEASGAATSDDRLPAKDGRTPADYRALPIHRPTAADGSATAGVAPGAQPPTHGDDLDGDPENFLRALWPLAERAAARLGLDPEALLAQAALETGWGGRMIRDPAGRNSHNLFGIKADARWDGERARVSSLEFEEGVAIRKRSDFRAYDSYADSFADYVDFISANPRYQEARAVAADSAAYFGALQRAGYATDPDYAAKVERILSGEPMQRVRTDPTTSGRGDEPGDRPRGV